ncbi:ammonia-dependent NAD(+) synthetase [uncultured Secundilactobacillus sp.]|uniref:ammonia-dependent NAD(+) synthetase n=1 Tax=uncultured Secundilactobacillus sp. TaxID=2813935 RepID=UPI00258C4719|nr:ammonia-dependent NAD(+) synthetase [uncultured Secundilactobacillus sp.]
MRALQREIIEALKVKPEIEPAVEIRRSVDFLKQYLTTTGLKGLVLGISGGQDSTLAGALSQQAVAELRTATGQNFQFIAVRLPYGVQADEQDAMAAIDFMKPDVTMRVDIKPATDAAVAAVADNGLQVTDFNKGNIKARQRMIAQYAIAGARGYAVVGTDHAAEAVTGFYTKFGDGAADITPLWRLDKRQGKQLLSALGAPKALYEKVPTADLEDDRPALPDEAALGVRYDDIDAYLEGREVTSKAAETIENWYVKTAHKRHLPINVYDTFWQV